MKHKFPQDAPIFGKPNIIINPQQLDTGKYIDMALNCFSSREIVELAEKYSADAKTFSQE